MADITLYSFTSTTQYKKIGDLLNDTKSVANIYKSTPDYFLSITGTDGLTNRQRIFNKFPKYRWDQLELFDSENIPLVTGTLLYVERNKVDDNMIVKTIEPVSTNTLVFKAEQLAKLEADTGYVSLTKPVDGFIQNGTLKTYYPDVTVWIWCKSLTPNLSEDELSGQFFDLTPYIESINTQMGKNGGNFEISLPPLVCELDANDRWVIKKDSITQYVQNNGTSLQGQGYVAQGSLYELQPDETGQQTLSRTEFLFKNMITANDLVFIRFETLRLEREQRYLENKTGIIDKSLLAGKIYDMIGLVDDCGMSVTAASNDVRISISGRDLSKLFLDDGTYFYALENTQGMIKIAGETRLKNPSVISRYAPDGSLLFLNLYQFNTIEYIVKFVLEQLSNITLVPSDLFTSYGNRVQQIQTVVNKRQSSGITSNNQKAAANYKYKPEEESVNAPGIWGIVKLLFDEEITKRRICDTSFSTASGSLINFIRGVAQEPLVEFFMDTYGDQYHLMFRKPPYDQKSIVSQIEGAVNTENPSANLTPVIVDIEAEDVISEKLSMNDTEVYSWYHLFPKFAMVGTELDFSMSYLPAVFFEEYAQAFGSRPFQQTHNYIPFDKNATLADFERQAINDLKYIIDCSQYLPFSRKGTITVNGDRRLKIGNMIRYKPTGEVFYIEHVIQHYSITADGIERTTTIHVARGLVEQLVYGVQIPDESGREHLVSYFNIINTTLNQLYKKTTVTNTVRKQVGTQEIEVPDYSLQGAENLLSGVANSVESFFGANGLDGKLQFPFANKGLALLDKYTNSTSKNIFIKFINLVNNAGYGVIITETVRPYKEQVRQKKINENNATPGFSKHDPSSQLAIDLNVINIHTGVQLYSWSSKADWIASGVPSIAQSMGISWGGNFNTYADYVHFYISSGTKTVTVPAYKEFKETSTVQAFNFDGVFSQFKVNKFSFNFFLKNMQFDPQYRVLRKGKAVINQSK